MQKLPAAALKMQPGHPTGNLPGPGLRGGCHLPLDLLFGCGLAGIIKIMVGPLSGKNWHSHNALLLHQSMLHAGARHSGYLLLCSAVHPFLPPKISVFPAHLILDIFLCTVPLPGEEVSLSLFFEWRMAVLDS